MKIDERTQVSLFAVFSAVPVLAVVAFWLASLDAKATANDNRIQRIEKQMEILFDIRDRIVRIEEQLKRRSK